jgi:hypothetical protein
LVSLAAILGPNVLLGAESPPIEPAERLVIQLSSDASIPADVRKLLVETWKTSADRDGAEFLSQALSVLQPKFRVVLEAFDADEHERCLAAARELTANVDPFISVHAAVYEVKSLVALQKRIEAGERISKLLENPGEAALASYTYSAGEMLFLQGYCLVGDLRYKEASAVLNRFLAEYPNAPLRQTIAAKQMLVELAAREPDGIEEVVDLMDFSHTRLKQFDSGSVVQARQQRILDLLDQLIKESEEKEKNCKCSKCGGGSGGAQGSNTPMPRSPMQESQLPMGAVPEGELREARRANPAESWGALPPLERERILQALRESFPNRYRKLVEQYYEQLAKKP